MHPKLLALALAALGATQISEGCTSFYLDGVWCEIKNGKLVAQASAARTGQIADRLKQAYSTQVVLYAAQANGWSIQQVGKAQYAVTRR
jgi:hypothetical protein